MEPIFTAAELVEIKAYHEPGYLYGLLDLLLWPVVLALLARYLTKPLFGLATRLTSRWHSTVLDRMWRGPGWGAAVLFSVALFFIFQLMDLPADIWFGFVREHEFGLSTMSFGTFALDLAKSYAMTALAVTSLAFGLFGLARRLKSWWLIMAVVSSLAMLSSALIDPYRARVFVEQEPLAEGPLRTEISRLMKRAQVDFSDVLVDKTSSRSVKLQAYFAGSGPTRTIVLNDSLIQNLSDDEVLAAVAHEAGHVHESRWGGRLWAVLALVAFLGFIEWVFRRAASRGWFGITERADVRVLPLLLLVFELAMALGEPFSAARSRAAETKADAFAVALTQQPSAFRSMLVKAARINKMDPSPPWWVALRQSHPPIAVRLAAIGQAETRR